MNLFIIFSETTQLRQILQDIRLKSCWKLETMSASSYQMKKIKQNIFFISNSFNSQFYLSCVSFNALRCKEKKVHKEEQSKVK